ncbi:rhomboid family intramembrane serine protease [Flavitalea sp. BT771]|uniref:rhomboid family protein n=1 Tax=Flavitalea sp. BT771 TaxID=3063329 RepID=UPI0026E2A68D|nr:rhomboid family intramembrane serine protease [Flavitalea sp. BT771]MDO6429363.1 rhomboid family intramembrane serine protease [Flavitalea sp. BT771]MDV6218509.1 rhomboid family intramembrane serine protease [Flavitalea sp. BT771]
MSNAGFIVLILVVITALISYKGFSNSLFFDKYKFEVDRILINKDYKRLFTSGFLHVSWTHLIFNMFGLYVFSGVVESTLGSLNFLIIYFASMVGGELLSLLIHRNEGDYSSVGATGAVCGVMFASVAIYPDMGIGLFLLPSIPGWVFALLYVLFSIYGIRSQKNNIGHDAHLGGALAGMLLALAMNPSVIIYNYGKILIILVPTVVFIYLIITRPGALLVDNLFYKTHKDFYSIDHKYNAELTDRQQEVDKILDKISKKGMGSLSKKEKETLEAYSKQVR